LVDFNPHQLDFDWRFTAASIFMIGEKVAPAAKLLLIGCPSLMHSTADKISSGLLVERNPYHRTLKKFGLLKTDVRFYRPRKKHAASFDAAIFDSPWYPDEFFSWANFALSYTRKGGSIFFVLWPEDTRPTGKDEHRRIFGLLRRIGPLKNLGAVSYELPPFELASLQLKARAINFRREGLLYSLTKTSDELLPTVQFKKSQTIWKRYRISSHQFALKVNPNEVDQLATCKFLIDPHVIDSTSRRNEELQDINIWTSNNVVAKLRNPRFVDQQIKKLKSGIVSDATIGFLKELGVFLDRKDADWGEMWQHRA